MNQKKLVSILLIICMLMTLMPTWALADDEPEPVLTQLTNEPSSTKNRLASVVPTSNEQGPVGKSASPVAKIGTVEYTSLADAIAKAQEGEIITLTADATLQAPVQLSKNITIQSADGNHYTISPAADFSIPAGVKNALLYVHGGTITLKNVTIDADEKCRAIVADAGKLTLDGAHVTGGYINDGYIAGIYVTNSASFEMTGDSDISGNTIAGQYAADGYLQYSADLWIGANATGSVAAVNGGKIGSVFVNANEYSSQNPGAFTLNGGAIDHLYVEYDKGYGGAFTYTTGTIQNLYLSTRTSGTSVPVAPQTGTTYRGGSMAAQNDGWGYTSLAEAIAAEGTTVTLLDDIKLTETQTISKALTLDLNGHTIEGSEQMNSVITIEKAAVTIQDSTAEAPSVGVNSAVSYSGGQIHGGYNAVVVNQGGSLTLLSGQLAADKNIALCVEGQKTYKDWATPIASQATVNGGYLTGREGAAAVLGNGAVLNINGGVLTATDNAVVAGNGSCSESSNKNYGGTTINISGGTMIGHITTPGYIACGVYHPQAGTLSITGGTIYADGGVGVLMRNGALTVSNDAIITGSGNTSGKVGDSTVIEAGYGLEIDYQAGYNHNNTTTDTRLVNITGGTINADKPTLAVYVRNAEGNKAVTSFITGGTFSSDPSAYVAVGYKAAADSAGQYTVTEMAENEAAVVPAEPDVKSELKGLTDETVTAVTTAVAQTEVTGLADVAAKTVAKNNTVTAEAGKSALGTANITVTDNDTVSIVVQPYIEITAKAYDAEGKTLTLDITPKYNTVATVANPNTDELVIAGDSVQNANAVIIDSASGKEMTITEPVTVTVTVPDGFLANDTSNLFVKHLAKSGTYYYKPTVDTDNKTLTFTNRHGFSEFQIQNDERKATIVFAPEGAVWTENRTLTAEAVGDSLSSQVPTKAGYTFAGWMITGVSGGPYLTLTDELLTKLAALNVSPITTTPSFSRNSSSSGSGGSGGGGGGTVSYTITATAGAGGQISPADKVSVTSGSSKTFTITAHTGYVIDDVLVDGKSVGAVGTYTFDKVTKAHTIEARFAQTTGLPFTDVSGSDWFYAPVKYVYNQKLMVGTAADQFSPSAPATRGMIVTMLWRMEGEPALEAAAGFNDVADGDWYAPAVRWAAGQGIVNGYGNGAFGPNDAITREQLAAILSNYAAYKGYSTAARADLSAYTDQPSAWAQSAVQWAVAEKLITGKGSGVLDPTGQATRAEIAAIVMRFITAFGQ